MFFLGVLKSDDINLAECYIVWGTLTWDNFSCCR